MALLRRSLGLSNLRNHIVSIRHSSVASNLNITEIQIPIHNNLVQGKWYGDKSIQPILALDGSLCKKHSLDKIARKLNSKSVLMIDMSDGVVPLPPTPTPTKPILGCSVDVSTRISPTRSPYPNSLEWLIIIRSVVKHFKWKRVTLLGHLLGAQLSFLYAGLFPAEINVLIAMERCLPNVHEPYDGPGNLARIIEQIMETESLDLNPDGNQKLNEKRDVTQYGDTNTSGVAAITNTNPIWEIKGTPWFTHPEILGYASRIISPTLILDNKGNRNNSVERLRLQEVMEIMFKQGTYVKHLRVGDAGVGEGDDSDDIARIIDCFIDEHRVYK